AAAVGGAEPEGVAGTAAAGVPGVATLTRVLGSAVHTAPDHVRVELATSGDHRALDVALAVRTAVSEAVHGHPPVTVRDRGEVAGECVGGAGAWSPAGCRALSR
ncbi:hypothetical protein ACFV5K_41315, partial [Streptomyces sp. NPDC059744]